MRIKKKGCTVNQYHDEQADITIINGDCMEGMKEMPDKAFELAIVDPPYREENQPTKDMRARGSMKTLTGRPQIEYWKELFRVSREQIIWGANNFQLPQFKGFVVWDKGVPFDFTMSMAEIAALSENLGTVSKILRLRVAGAECRIHPTQKPVALYKWLLKNYAKPGDKILDTHGGSCSLAIACQIMGFSATIYEIDEDYFTAAVERYKRHIQQQTLFGWEEK
jgi:site-specific DNA-methyltransferase (adenine-specific)